MAVIIPLKREVDLPLETAVAAASLEMPTADLILFPGVRYEHWDGAEGGPVTDANAISPAQLTVVRDWLEI
jgi:hypothetical protein